jgi:ankyrin repeat protein
MVVVLLESGADPNLKNKDENTPLHVAAAEGREEVVKRLVRRLHARKAANRMCHASCFLHSFRFKKAPTWPLGTSSGGSPATGLQLVVTPQC